MTQAFTRATASFSPCAKYRYALSREWDAPTQRRCLFIMLNPSTADELVLDPTVRKCVGYAKRWGYGALDIANLFAWRSTDKSVLPSLHDPVGEENDVFISRLAGSASLVVCGWGADGGLRNRAGLVLRALVLSGHSPKCLHLTKGGEPGHPLYLKNEAPLIDLPKVMVA